MAALLLGSVAPVVLLAASAPAAPLVPVAVAVPPGLGPSLGPLAEVRLRIDVVLRADARGVVSTARLAAVRSWLAGAGLSAAQRGDALVLEAPSAAISRAFSVRFARHRDGGAVVYASSTPRLPAPIAADVTTILGLSDGPAATPNLLVGHAVPATTAAATGSSCTGDGSGFSMQSVGDYYGLSALEAAGDEGQGVSIAAVELGAASPQDVSTYDACMSPSSPPYSTVAVDGGAPAGGSGTMEADLDIEQLQSQAPQADVVSYEAPDTNVGLYDALAAIVDANSSRVVTISWTGCELDSASYAEALDGLLERAANQGQTVLVAAGDDGSEGCYGESTSSPYRTDLAAEYPADSPSVTAVGGTDLSSLQSPGADIVWNDCELGPSSCPSVAGNGAGGGGVSQVFAEPSWQQGAVGTLRGPSGGSGRGVPDVALKADGAGTGAGQAGFANGNWGTFGGTSLAAPMLAGFVADAATTCSTEIGNLAPRLYADFSDGGAMTRDVTSGDNDFLRAHGGSYSAGPGYDLASGLGTVNAAALVCPSIASLSESSGNAGDSLTITGSGFSNAPTVEFGSATASVTASSATSVTVTVPPGAGAVPVTVANEMGASLPASFTYPAPAVSSPDSVNGTVGSPFSFTVSATGDPTPTLSVSGLPAGLSFQTNGDGTGTITGTPEAQGSSIATVTAANSAGTASQQLSITVDAAAVVTTTTTTTTTSPPPAPPPTATPTSGTTSPPPATTSPPATTTTTLPRVPLLFPLSARATASRSTVSVLLGCRAAICRGRTVLAQTRRVRVRSGKRFVIRNVTTTIAVGSVAMAPNLRRLASLRLTPAGAALFRRAHLAVLTLRLIWSGKTSSHRLVVVMPPPKKAAAKKAVAKKAVAKKAVAKKVVAPVKTRRV